MCSILLGCSLFLNPSQAAGWKAEILPLHPAQPIEREIAADEVHPYEVASGARQYTRIVIEQKTADLVVRVSTGEAPPLTVVNSLEETGVPEVVSLLSEQPLTYRLELRPALGSAGGLYSIRIDEQRPANPEDPVRIAAERAEAEADRLYEQPTPERLERALAAYRTALDLWRELGETHKEAEILYRLGAVQRLRGEPEEALGLFDQAIAAVRRTGDLKWQANALNQKGLVYTGLARFADALAAYAQAQELQSRLGDPSARARILNNIGLVHQLRGDALEAQAMYREALEIFRLTGDRARQGRALGNLASTHSALGEPLAALELFEQALAIARSLQDKTTEAEWLNHLGLIKYRLGDPQAAFENYAAALDLVRSTGDRVRQAVVLGNLGSTSLDLNEPERAADAFEEAIRLQHATAARRDEAISLSQLGRAYSRLDRPSEALDCFARALAIQREVGDRANEATTLRHLGSHHLSQGNPREALPPLLGALEISRASGDLDREARTRHDLGLAQASVGDTAAAFSSFEEALRLRRAVSDPVGEVAALQEIARLEMARGQLAAARARIEPALEMIESLRVRVSADRLRSSYFASLHAAYRTYVEILMALHRQQPEAGFDARAFEAAERARARSLLDLLREARVELRRGVDPQLVEEEKTLRIGLNAKAERLTRLLELKAAEKEVAAARREVDEAFTTYELAEARMRAALPEYADLVRPQPVSLPAIQALLDGDTVLLEVALGETRSFLWIVSRTAFESRELPAQAEIEAAAREAYEALGSPNPSRGREHRQALARLGRMLLEPVAGRPERRLAVVAGGALEYIPFAALTLPSSEPALARFEVVSLPSAAVLGELRRRTEDRPASQGALAILADPVFSADDPRIGVGVSRPVSETKETDLLRAARAGGQDGFPRLSWTRREAEAAAAQASPRPILEALDFQASLDTVTGPELARYGIVHFATHGFVNDRNPELSGLVLSLVDPQGNPREGFLRLSDIYNLDLGADLVVLSGCQTALGKQIRGEGLLGLTRGFFYAGASQVVASLWPVGDRATAELMERFYRNLFHGGMSPAAALHAAQSSLRQEPRWRNPFFWAPFVLQGDWEAPAERAALPGGRRRGP